MQIDKAKEILKNAGRSLVSEENVQLSDKFRTAWNSLMSAMSDFTNWNRVVMWYVGDKYEKKATALSEAYARGQCSLHEIIEKMKNAGSQWYRDLFSEIDAILKKNLEVTGDRGEFSYGDKYYKIVPVCNSVGSKCSFEIRENSDEDEVFKRTPFIENPDEALDALERIIEEKFSDTHRQFSEAKELLESVGMRIEEDTLEAKSKLADNFIHSILLEIEKYTSGRTSRYFKHYEIEIMRQIMAFVYEYAQRTCELSGSPCNLETLKQVIKSEYDANHVGK
jgi:hypothetical protein